MPITQDRTPRYVLYSASDQLLRLSEVSPLAELAHRRFADHFWATGTWPALGSIAILRLARVSGPRLKLLLPELQALGWVEHNGQLRNPDVAETLQRAVAAARARSASAVLAAATRWEAAKAPTPTPVLPPRAARPVRH